MSIEPIGKVDSNTTPLIELQQLFQVSHDQHRSARRDLSGLSDLTAADRDFFSAVYGPDVLTVGTSDAARIAAPQLLFDVIADRRSGLLPVGTELTSTYVQARFDASVDLNGTVTNPLTEQNLADAQAYFNDRVQGAAIDLQA